MQKWINVNNKMPDEDIRVLVCCQTKKGVRSINIAYQTYGMWHGYGSMSGVTHWMPLPDIPKD